MFERVLSLPYLFIATTLLVSPVANAQQDDDVIEEIVVFGKKSQVELTAEYAGGQVARGARAGLLGNLDYLDSPFSSTAYTAGLSLAQQSESVGDVLQNDPVVRVAKGFGNFQEVYFIRGFPVFSDDLTLNGVFGIVPRQFVAAELIERVEVFRGVNAFINGAAPGDSSVGGSVNLVPKRAPEDGIRNVTIGFEEAGQSYGALDLGSRFGTSDNWGVRFNAVLRDGETSIEDQDRSLTAVSLGTDYAGESFRFSADLGYQDNQLDVPRPQVTPFGEIPREPDADSNFAQPWTFSKEEQLFFVARGEYDFNDSVSAWLGAGFRNGDEENRLANPNAAADGSLTAFRFDNVREDDIRSFDAGVQAAFWTGDVGHRVVLSWSSISLEFDNAFAFSDFFSPFATDLYDPVTVAPPPVDFFVGGDLGNPLKTQEDNNDSLAIAYSASLADERFLATFGLRRQDIETKAFDATSGALTSEYDSDATTPFFGLVWRLSEQISIYGNYAESLEAGEVAPAVSGGTPISNAGEILDPFTGEQIEVGLKYDGGDIGATASLFTIDRSNAIVVGDRFVDSGSQENTGIELSVFGQPTEGFRIIGGATWLDSELARTEGGVNEGNTPIGVPEFQVNLNVEWDLDALPGLTLDGRVIHTGSQYTNAENTIKLDSWRRLDLGARYAFDVSGRPVTVRLRMDNALDEEYWASVGGFPGANYLILGNPRTLSLTATMSF